MNHNKLLSFLYTSILKREKNVEIKKDQKIKLNRKRSETNKKQVRGKRSNDVPFAWLKATIIT